MPGIADFDEQFRNFISAAVQDVVPLLREAVEHLGLTSEQASELSDFMLRAWAIGSHAGQAEMVAQAIEQGTHVEVRSFLPPSREQSGDAGDESSG